MAEIINSNKAFDESLKEFERLTREEYGVEFDQLILELKSKEEAREKFARLLGTLLKEPFRETCDIAIGESYIRGGAWDSSKYYALEADGLWQKKVISELNMEQGKDDELPGYFLSYLSRNMHEVGVAQYLLRSTRRYICANKDTRNEIKTVMDEAKNQGIVNPQSLISYAGGAVSGIIVTSVPYGAAFAPLAGGITILILMIGMDAFCDWVRDHATDDERWLLPK
jgi:hypothetical protein